VAGPAVYSDTGGVPGGEAEPPNEACAEVADDISVEVGHHQDVKEVRVSHNLTHSTGGGEKQQKRKKDKGLLHFFLLLLLLKKKKSPFKIVLSGKGEHHQDKQDKHVHGNLKQSTLYSPSCSSYR